MANEVANMVIDIPGQTRTDQDRLGRTYMEIGQFPICAMFYTFPIKAVIIGFVGKKCIYFLPTYKIFLSRTKSFF